ncbi:glycosyltransferase [Euhalothece natronophila Z-M001]|uniref:Glycosyltransferase n=1 Tax=Euhalothece natronophila Z-M001 TaxID=522448 RepID=A0A5B8NHK6_9CHRO|nr:glycosyltransferase [Euhalothece natronophila]QDZ38662.1 glycosyltransferase [Euhalothece natronophila Z-M001]
MIDIIIPIFNSYPLLKNCLESVVKHFDSEARLILLDDGSTDPNIAIYLEEIKKNAQFPVLIHQNQHNQGFVKTVNQGIQFSKENDIILLHSDTIVTQNWISKLKQAAYLKENIATVTPLSNNATIFSIPEFGKFNEIPKGYDIESFAQLVEETSCYLYPEVPVGHGFCLYIKRTTFNLLGDLDEDYNRSCGSEYDFCLRVLSYSLCNIMADDTFIYHSKNISDVNNQPFQGELLVQKYPFYWDLIQFYQKNKSNQIWDNIQVKTRQLRIGLDGRCLDDTFAGNQRYLIELIRAYTEKVTNIKVDLLVNNNRQNYVKEVLNTFGIKESPNLIEEASLQSNPKQELWDVFHITLQGTLLQNLATLRPHAKRIIITLQDFILAKNPLYFKDNNWFYYYYLIMQVYLASVDGVITISNFIKDELLSVNTFAKHENDLIHPERVKTVYHGINQRYDSISDVDESFCQEMGITPQKYLLFVGNDYLHKNLEATVKVLEKTQKLGYHYQLVIVGNTIAQGGSKQKLQESLEQETSLKENIFFLNHVSDEMLLKLYGNAGVLLYLSNSEGFGFPPLEAFAHGCPVITSNLTSIPEVVGEGAISFHPGEIEKIASTVIELIENQKQRDRAIKKGRKKVQEFDWRKTAKETINFYNHILRLPPRFQKNLPSLYLESQRLKDVQIQLRNTQNELQNTQHQLQHTKTQLQDTQHQLQHTKTQLQDTQHQLQHTKTQLQDTQHQLQDKEIEIETMKRSKFWKLREKWFKVKAWLRLAELEE